MKRTFYAPLSLIAQGACVGAVLEEFPAVKIPGKVSIITINICLPAAQSINLE